MICVSAEKGEQKLTLNVEGHAGFAKLGDDIVCAAASMLAQALLYALEGVDGICLESDVRSGHLWLQCTSNPETRAMMAVAEAGFEQLAEAYPSHIEYTA